VLILTCDPGIPLILPHYYFSRLNKANYFTPVAPGDVFNGSATAEVIASKSEKFAVGDNVSGFLYWKRVQIAPAAGLTKLRLGGKISSPSQYLGLLGLTGLSSYFPINDFVLPHFAGLPSSSEPRVAFISGAAGAVGFTVGQILKHVYGWRVYGSASSQDKLDFLAKGGFDGSFNYRNYKTVEELDQQLKTLIPGVHDDLHTHKTINQTNKQTNKQNILT